MQDYNSYDLFVKNPRIHTNFPFLALDCNNKKTIPPRMRFQEMHWHEDIQITYVLEVIIKITWKNDRSSSRRSCFYFSKSISSVYRSRNSTLSFFSFSKKFY